jgi:hypothetical protein
MKVIAHDGMYTITDIIEVEMERLRNLTAGHYYPEVRHIKEALENPEESNCIYRAMGFC